MNQWQHVGGYDSSKEGEVDGQVGVAYRAVQPASSFVRYRLETAVKNPNSGAGQPMVLWALIGFVESTPHVMQVILDKVSPLEGVRAIWPDGKIMNPGMGY